MEVRTLQRRQENLAAVVKTFKDSVESDNARAPQALREEALTGMWQFSKVREKIPAAVYDLAEYMDRVNPPREDPVFLCKIMRISLALYLLDKMDEISRSVASDRGFNMTVLFSTARAAVGRLLDSKYFDKGRSEIINGYLEAEPSLLAIAAVCKVQTLDLYDAVRIYKRNVADMLPEGPLEPPPEYASAAR